MKHELAIMGGGLIGLSIAYEFARNGQSVVVVDQAMISPQTSWAAVGILPAVNQKTQTEPFDQLRAMSDELHWIWSAELKSSTGLSNELKSVGTLFVARSPGEVASLLGYKTKLEEEEIEFEVATDERLDQLFPDLSSPLSGRKILQSLFVPGEKTIRNSRHLRALKTACEQMGVQFHCITNKLTVDQHRDRVDALVFDSKRIQADNFCFAGGSWTQKMLEPLGFHISTVPIRGQILLYKLPSARFEPVLYEGSQYIVPRTDGHVLVGSTLEDAGFDNSTTTESINRLKEFAYDWERELNDSNFVTSWAGLRPGTNDGMPYIGRLANWHNAFVATGHFRSGIHMSPGTAVIMHQLINGQPTAIDISHFNPNRG